MTGTVWVITDIFIKEPRQFWFTGFAGIIRLPIRGEHTGFWVAYQRVWQVTLAAA